MIEDFALPGADDNPANAVTDAVNVHALYWSIRGEVACAIHAPQLSSHRWSHERWAEIPAVRRRNGVRYQCQHCADSKTPILHRRLNTQIQLNHVDA